MRQARGDRIISGQHAGSNSLTQLTQHRVNHLVPSQTKCSIRESHPTLHLISVAPLELGNHARPPYCDHFTAVNVDGWALNIVSTAIWATGRRRGRHT